MERTLREHGLERRRPTCASQNDMAQERYRLFHMHCCNGCYSAFCSLVDARRPRLRCSFRLISSSSIPRTDRYARLADRRSQSKRFSRYPAPFLPQALLVKRASLVHAWGSKRILESLNPLHCLYCTLPDACKGPPSLTSFISKHLQR